jgi:hypothetical protein
VVWPAPRNGPLGNEWDVWGLTDFCLRQIDLALQFPPLHYSRCSRRKKVACAPPGVAIQDVPFKRAVRARMPPHVEEPLVHRLLRLPPHGRLISVLI